MRFVKPITVAALLLTAALPALAVTHSRRGPTSHLFVKKKIKPGYKPAGGIAPERATEIQTALIKAGYMTGAPTGTWDATSEVAMQKMQGDNGWQTKITPDARALIKLGLGPNDSATETASTTPDASSQESSN